MGRRSGECHSCVRRHRTSDPALCRAASSTRPGSWISPTRTGSRMAGRFTSTIPNESGTTPRPPRPERIHLGRRDGRALLQRNGRLSGASPHAHVQPARQQPRDHELRRFGPRRVLRRGHASAGAVLPDGGRAGGAGRRTPSFRRPAISYLLVANQNGKKFERILTDYRNGDLHPGTRGDARSRELHDAERSARARIRCAARTTRRSVLRAATGLSGLRVAQRRRDARLQPVHDADVDRGGIRFAGDSARRLRLRRGQRLGLRQRRRRQRRESRRLVPLPRAGRQGVYSPDNPPNVPVRQQIAHDDRAPRDAHGVAKTRDGRTSGSSIAPPTWRKSTGPIRAPTVETLNLADPDISSDPTPDLADNRRMGASSTSPRGVRCHSRATPMPPRVRRLACSCSNCSRMDDRRGSRARSHHQYGCRRSRAGRRPRHPRAPAAEREALTANATVTIEPELGRGGQFVVCRSDEACRCVTS